MTASNSSKGYLLAVSLLAVAALALFAGREASRLSQVADRLEAVSSDLARVSMGEVAGAALVGTWTSKRNKDVLFVFSPNNNYLVLLKNNVIHEGRWGSDGSRFKATAMILDSFDTMYFRVEAVSAQPPEVRIVGDLHSFDGVVLTRVPRLPASKP